MKIIAIIFLFLISAVWYILWWKYIQFWEENLLSSWNFWFSREDSIVLIILAWLFVLWVLFWKLLTSKWTSNNTHFNNWHNWSTQQWFNFIPEIEENHNNSTSQKQSIHWYNSKDEEERPQIQSNDSKQIQLIHDDDFDYWPESHETKVEVENILIVNERKEAKIEEQYNITDNSTYIHIENTGDTTMLNVAKRMRKWQKDDLKIIEWIWPKIESILNNWGIISYRDLSETNVSDIKDLLAKQWPRYALHNPTTWPRQAYLADKKKFDELSQYQKTLNKWVEKK